MILRILALSTSLALTAVLCRFTVRDVGFVDLGDPGYQYYTFVSDAESPGVAASSQRVAQAVFADTNVEFAVVDIDAEVDENHPAQRYARELKLQKFPTTVLVSPEGHAVELPIPGEFDAAGARVFESVASSKLRRRITESVLRRYCVVLLVEGTGTKQNQAAAGAVQAAFDAIEKIFDRMPKDVGALPELMTVPRTEQASEKVLLWSLGIDAGGEQPVVTILTGRGRQFGPMLDGAGITEDSLLDILAKVGESCECGLDRSWMRGRRVPLRWDADTRQLAVDLLGFDPENPLVKSEITGILARGPNGKIPGTKGEPSVADMLLGYSEAGVAEVDPGDTDPAVADPALAVQPVEAAAAAGDHEGTASGLAILWTLGGVLLVSLGVAAFVLLRVPHPRRQV